MEHGLHQIDLKFKTDIESTLQNSAIQALENGQVLYLPHYFFKLESNEIGLLSPEIIQGKNKNLSYDYRNQQLSGINTKKMQGHDPTVLQAMMHRFAEFSKALVDALIPSYQASILWGRTSYRPIEVAGRVRSKRQNDARLHIDAFPATPVNGRRILRIFCNINPDGKPRVWELGEAFPKVLEQFSDTISAFNPVVSKCLQWLGITKSYRSAYDHYMLKLHDTMKLDDTYQQRVKKQRVDFPPGSTWIAFTDQVSHAALDGQYLLEQTFYLPITAMQTPEHSPLWQWEAKKGELLTV